MKDFIIVAVSVVILGLAAFYVYKAKKNGKKHGEVKKIHG